MSVTNVDDIAPRDSSLSTGDREVEEGAPPALEHRPPSSQTTTSARSQLSKGQEASTSTLCPTGAVDKERHGALDVLVASTAKVTASQTSGTAQSIREEHSITRATGTEHTAPSLIRSASAPESTATISTVRTSEPFASPSRVSTATSQPVPVLAPAPMVQLAPLHSHASVTTRSIKLLEHVDDAHVSADTREVALRELLESNDAVEAKDVARTHALAQAGKLTVFRIAMTERIASAALEGKLEEIARSSGICFSQLRRESKSTFVYTAIGLSSSVSKARALVEARLGQSPLGQFVSVLMPSAADEEEVEGELSDYKLALRPFAASQQPRSLLAVLTGLAPARPVGTTSAASPQISRHSLPAFFALTLASPLSLSESMTPRTRSGKSSPHPSRLATPASSLPGSPLFSSGFSQLGPASPSPSIVNSDDSQRRGSLTLPPDDELYFISPTGDPDAVRGTHDRSAPPIPAINLFDGSCKGQESLGRHIAMLASDVANLVDHGALVRLKMSIGRQLFTMPKGMSAPDGRGFEPEQVLKWKIDGADGHMRAVFSPALTRGTLEAVRDRLVHSLGLRLVSETSVCHIDVLDSWRCEYVQVTAELRGGEIRFAEPGHRSSGSLALVKCATLPSKQLFWSLARPTTPSSSRHDDECAQDVRVKLYTNKAATIASDPLCEAVATASWDLSPDSRFSVHLDLPPRFPSTEMSVRFVGSQKYDLDGVVRVTLREIRPNATRDVYYEVELNPLGLNEFLRAHTTSNGRAGSGPPPTAATATSSSAPPAPPLAPTLAHSTSPPVPSILASSSHAQPGAGGNGASGAAPTSSSASSSFVPVQDVAREMSRALGLALALAPPPSASSSGDNDDDEDGSGARSPLSALSRQSSYLNVQHAEYDRDDDDDDDARTSPLFVRGGGGGAGEHAEDSEQQQQAQEGSSKTTTTTTKRSVSWTATKLEAAAVAEDLSL